MSLTCIGTKNEQMATHQSITPSTDRRLHSAIYPFSSRTDDCFLHLRNCEFHSFFHYYYNQRTISKDEKPFHKQVPFIEHILANRQFAFWKSNPATITTNSSPKSRHFGVSLENCFFLRNIKLLFAFSDFLREKFF